MFKNYLVKKRIKKFLAAMSRVLSQDYGRNSEYTKGQVETATKKLGYVDCELLSIAVAIYCTVEVAEVFGMDDALIKKYRGYPERCRIAFDHATAVGSYNITGLND